MYRLKNLITLSLLCLTAACAQTGVPNSPGAPGGSTDIGAIEPYIMKGQVTNSQGMPLEGVEVTADHTIAGNAYLGGTTDASGTYRIDLSGVTPGSWHASAYVKPTYEGQTFNIALHPDNDSSFAGVDGGIRNFTWNLTGATPDGGVYGGTVFIDYDINYPGYEPANATLIFTPDGPLIDGSIGQPLSLTPEGTYIYDVPVGRYTVTGSYAAADGSVRPLGLGVGLFAENLLPSVTLIFEDDGVKGPLAELTVQVQ